MSVCLRTESDEFRRMLEARYAGFVPSLRDSEPLAPRSPGTDVPGAHIPPLRGSGIERREGFVLEVGLLPDSAIGGDEDVRVRRESGRWVVTRGDFRAEWEPERRRGWVRQTANPYAIDSVLRILHTLLLAEEGGFLLHAASAIRKGKAFLFSGKSEAGKTTISRLAPGDVTLLTDEISYVRQERPQHKGHEGKHDGHKGYLAYGTRFAGELAKGGENVCAPIAGLYFLEKAPQNRIEPLGTAEALFRLMQNILFFAEDERLVRQVFEAAGEFVSNVPSYRLEFVPDARVWELMA